MSKSIRAVAALLALLSFGAATSLCRAGAMTGGSTEVTQILNNVELVAGVQKQAATVSQLAQSYVVQYNQLKEQISAGLKIGGLSFGDVMKMKSDMESYQNALKTFGTDLANYQNTINVRSIEAKLQNLSLQDYIAREGQKVQSGNDQAKARIQREIAQAEQIKDDIATVRTLGAKIENTDGVHSATQLLNSQMNLMLQQMTRLVSLTSEAQGTDKAAAMAKEAADRQAARSAADQIISNENAIRSRNKGLIDAMISTPAK
ncbi:MAG: hypothetical protein Q7V53_01820 [Caldisericota bacterium]|nr:hypothetical protein [Caldisericota bacterium]